MHAFEILETTLSQDLGIRIHADPLTDLHRYNVPSINEITVIVPGAQNIVKDPQDIVLHCHSGQLHLIHDHHHAYAQLHYILLFPHGTAGWTYSLKLE